MSALVRNRQLLLVGATLAGLVLTQPGCRVVGGVFKAGLWVGIIGVVLVVALVAGLVSLLRRAAPGRREPLP